MLIEAEISNSESGEKSKAIELRKKPQLKKTTTERFSNPIPSLTLTKQASNES